MINVSRGCFFFRARRVAQVSVRSQVNCTRATITFHAGTVWRGAARSGMPSCRVTLMSSPLDPGLADKVRLTPSSILVDFNELSQCITVEIFLLAIPRTVSYNGTRTPKLEEGIMKFNLRGNLC